MQESIIIKRDRQAIERLRKPISATLAVILLSYAILIVPVGLDTLPYEVAGMVGFIFLIIAALGRLWCSIYISGRKNTELCVSGPYAHCRNPLYFFSFAGVIGFALAVQNISLMLMGALIFLIYYHYVIKSEEERLIRLFPVECKKYFLETPRFWPLLKKPIRISASYNILNPRLLEKSLLEVVWFLLAIVLAETLEFIHGSGYAILYTLPF